MQANAVFHDPLDTMLDELEHSIQANHVAPAPVPKETGVDENLSWGDLPQQQSWQFVSEHESVDSPPLPYYIDTLQQDASFHATPHCPAARVGRRGGGGLINSYTGPGDKIYCPIEKNYVVFPDFCEKQNCEYYTEDSDQENGLSCTYHNEENF